MRMLLRAILVIFTLGTSALAQSIEPVISEYKGVGEGKFKLTNNTLLPMVVVLDPMSFSITPEGKGIFRPLDSGIHVELSSMSARLQPKQSYYVFYKASAEKLPAWFTVYATFSSPHHGEGLDLRLMFPHTVYLYQKTPLAEPDIQVNDLTFDSGTQMLTCDLENRGGGLGRVQSVRATGVHGTGDAPGFPLLPGGHRHIAMPWTQHSPPTELQIRFERFTLTRAVKVKSD